ncbi:MAG: GC-type dockerin domain-anchored protein [Phycisphaerales bacterium JB064]
MLDAIATNYQGTLVIEAAPMPRTLSTTSECLPTIVEAVTFERMTQQGSWMRRTRFFDDQPHHRGSPLFVDSTCYVTLSFRQFYAENHANDIRWRFEDVMWAGPADFNVDGVADVFDFLAFQNAFAVEDMAADFDRDGKLSIFDFLSFFNLFPSAAGATP